MSLTLPHPPSPTDPLKQSERLLAPFGAGAITLIECSNCAAEEPRPRITLLTPEWVPDNAEERVIPARSFEVSGFMARQLYEFLHSYYRRSGQHLTT